MGGRQFSPGCVSSKVHECLLFSSHCAFLYFSFIIKYLKRVIDVSCPNSSCFTFLELTIIRISTPSLDRKLLCQGHHDLSVTTCMVSLHPHLTWVINSGSSSLLVLFMSLPSAAHLTFLSCCPCTSFMSLNTTCWPLISI